MLEFTEEENFAVDGSEFFDGAANPKARLSSVLLDGIGDVVWVTKESGAEGGFAAVGAENFKADCVEVGAEEGARLVAGGGAKKGEKSLLGELFGVGRIEDAAAKETVNGLFVAAKELGESFGGAALSVMS